MAGSCPSGCVSRGFFSHVISVVATASFLFVLQRKESCGLTLLSGTKQSRVALAPLSASCFSPLASDASCPARRSMSLAAFVSSPSSSQIADRLLSLLETTKRYRHVSASHSAIDDAPTHGQRQSHGEQRLCSLIKNHTLPHTCRFFCNRRGAVPLVPNRQIDREEDQQSSSASSKLSHAAAVNDASNSVCSLAFPPATLTSTSTPESSPYIVMQDGSYRRHWKFTRTKQVVTVGPSSSSERAIEDMFLSGADIFRLNFSHGLHEEKARMVTMIRQVEKKYKHPIAILADLQGPKVRIGMFASDATTVQLQKGQTFQFDLSAQPGDLHRVQLPHREILSALKTGDVLLLDDGKVKVKVTECFPNAAKTEVVVGGPLSSKKGINIPTLVVPISALSEKDRTDALFAHQLEVDWIALSFVQRPGDMTELRNLLGTQDDELRRPGLIAKIERPAAVDRIEEILSVSDGIMVARGDLGVEISPECVPVVQKRLVRKAREAGKPVIVATQMLDSMVNSPSPTRAEASDVATAIFEGADAVMLSGETAAGRFPLDSVKMQRRIIEIVESDSEYWEAAASSRLQEEGASASSATDAITRAARDVAETMGARAVAVYTMEGLTVERASKLRPKVPVLAITPLVQEARRLQLFWGVFPVVDTNLWETEDCYIEKMVCRACELARREGLLESPEDLLILTTGVPFGKHGGTNVLRVCKGSQCGTWTKGF